MKRIIISRTDSIGDTILTLPMCGYLKKVMPDTTIIYLGKGYVKPIVSLSEHVDEFAEFVEGSNHEDLLASLNADAIIHVFPRKTLAQAARNTGIPVRIGTAGRSYHWGACNKKVKFTRKRSDLHESQLNFKLLKGIGIDYAPHLEEIDQYYGVKKSSGKSKHVILHPGSRGSAVEWPFEKFAQLAKEIAETGLLVTVTGTEEEGTSFREAFTFTDKIVDLSGKQTLNELINYIGTASHLVACSTGPLHIAAMLGVKAVGLYVDIRPIHPGRWAPVGSNTIVLMPPTSGQRADIANITVQQVFEEVCEQ